MPCRGLNALEIVSYLTAALHVCESDAQKFTSALESLYAQGFLENLVNQKITAPGQVNFSDDELAFLAYYAWGFPVMQMKKSGAVLCLC
jgi:hypothetical protein